jgi:histidine triad (HIT) family protein
MSTIFSKIIAGEIPSYKVYEDDYVYAFLDINPISRGHTLVVPKQEVDYLFAIDEVGYDKLMHRVRYVAQVLKAKLGCERVCVIVEGYAVPHAHVHLIPTNKPEDLDKHLAHKATEEELKEVHDLLTC